MKPQIIYIKEDGNLKITQEKLDELLREAYNQGYEDGKQSLTYDYNVYRPWWKDVYYTNSPTITCKTCNDLHGFTTTSNEFTYSADLNNTACCGSNCDKGCHSK